MEDGFYHFGQVSETLEDSFKSEKDLCNFIEANIKEFCKDSLGIEYLSHKREYPLFNSNRNKRGCKRLDFLINSKCGQSIAIECKHPTYISELCAGVGQVLSYIVLFRHQGKHIDRFVIVSSKIDWMLPAVLGTFILPIEFIAFDKKKSLTWQGQKKQ